MSDALRKLIEQQEAMQRLTEPLRGISASLKSLTDLHDKAGLNSGLQQFLRIGEESRKLVSSLQDGPIAEMMHQTEQHRQLIEGTRDQARRLGLLDPGAVSGDPLSALSAERERFEKMFQLPAVSDIGRLALEALGPYALGTDTLTASGRRRDLESAMGTMTSPWLNMEHQQQSARAFGSLMDIGHGVSRLAPFEAALAENLRGSLGDWRDPITMLDAWKDPIRRSGFYAERGFDPALVEFTREAFVETVEVAGLALPSDPETDDESDKVERSDRAFGQLSGMERAVRRFITRFMNDAFGETWMKRQLPAGMLDRWIDKRDKAVTAGRPEEPLINYADFTDYVLIIERRDNWSSVFKAVFVRPENIRESFQRLFPLRIATMHSLFINSDDELLLMSEVRRIMRAIEL